jgi:hypothetical protein
MDISGFIKKINEKTLVILNKENKENEINVPSIEITKHKLEVGDYISIKKDKCFIIMVISEEIILRNIKNILNIKDLAAANLLNKIKKKLSFESSLKKIEEIENYLSYLCFNKYLIYKPDTKIIGVPTKQMSELLKGWKKRDCRRLNLIGLTDKEITDTGIYPYKLYEMCVKNPFAVPSITLEKASEIYYYFGNQTDEKKDIVYGELLRSIYYACKKKAWTSFPISKLKGCDNLINNTLLLDYYNMIIKNKCIYYKEHYLIEENVVNFLLNKIRENDEPPSYFYFECDKFMKVEDKNITLEPQQIAAVENMLNKNISITTGGPGTGKTTILKKFKEICDNNNKSFIVLGPTGKSVSRIKKAVEYKKSREEDLGEDNYHTIDRLIYTGFVKQFDYLVLDEFSMITTEKFKELLDHLGERKFRITFIGDNNQLPPIGWGYLSKELIKCELIPTTTLKVNHRSEDISLVSQANEFISQYDEDFQFKETDYFHLYQLKKYDNEEESQIRGYNRIFNILKKLKELKINQNNISIITPKNEDRIICADLFRKIFILENEYVDTQEDLIMIEKLLEEQRKNKRYANTGLKDMFIKGDRVMNLKNNNFHKVMNGDEGTVKDVDEDYVVVEIDKENFLFHFKPNHERQDLDVHDLEYGQAKTVHKSQGDEVDYLIAYLPYGGKGFINRNLLYTMLTRAKKEIWFLYDKESLMNAIKTEIEDKYDGISNQLILRYQLQ